MKKKNETAKFVDEMFKVLSKNEGDSLEVPNPFGEGVIKLTKSRHNNQLSLGMQLPPSMPVAALEKSREEVDEDTLFWSS